MGRGLSDLQKTILERARETRKVNYADIYRGFYGTGATNAKRAAVSRAVARLVERGLVTRETKRSHQAAAVTLTVEGSLAAQKLAQHSGGPASIPKARMDRLLTHVRPLLKQLKAQAKKAPSPAWFRTIGDLACKLEDACRPLTVSANRKDESGAGDSMERYAMRLDLPALIEIIKAQAGSNAATVCPAIVISAACFIERVIQALSVNSNRLPPPPRRKFK